MGIDELERRTDEAEREALAAVDEFLRARNQPVPALVKLESLTYFEHEWDERTRKCRQCGIAEAAFKLSRNPEACIVRLDSQEATLLEKLEKLIDSWEAVP